MNEQRLAEIEARLSCGDGMCKREVVLWFVMLAVEVVILGAVGGGANPVGRVLMGIGIAIAGMTLMAALRRP